MDNGNEKTSRWSGLKNLMLQEVPAYANKIYYSMGFLSMTSFVLLIASGAVLVFFGPNWWLTTQAGLVFRSIHLWSAQAFIFFIFLHLLVVFLTSGFKGKRRLTWVLGSLMLFFALVEAEFGYGLRGDFSSEWRSLQASDLYNGAGLGKFINNLNYAQIYGIHIILIPIIILGLLFLHYFLVRFLGIAKPYDPNAKYRMVKANHKVLFFRGAVLAAVIIVLALVFPSPLIIPTTIQSVAEDSPGLVATTLLSEMSRTSGTATYFDGIDPYTYDTRTVYISDPYAEYVQTIGAADMMAVFNSENAVTQNSNIQSAIQYFSNGELSDANASTTNPAISVVGTLVNMAKSGLYEGALNNESANGLNDTYVERFLSDTGVLEAKAQRLGITTDQYGMVHEESGGLPGAWWLAPLGLLDHTILATDPNQDRDGAEILGLLILLLIAFPYIPYVNRIPEKLRLAKRIWKDGDIMKP